MPLLIGVVIGIVLGIVLKKKSLFYTFLGFEIIYILFAPKTIFDLGKSGMSAMLGIRSPGLVIIAIIATAILYGLFFVVIVKQIILSVIHIYETKYKLILGINVLAIISFVFWIIGILTIYAGFYRIPSPYPLGIYGSLVLVTVGLTVFDSIDLDIDKVPMFNKENLPSIGKNNNLNVERYKNNRSLLDEHYELGVISQQDYQKILVKLVLLESDEKIKNDNHITNTENLKVNEEKNGH